jgi:membrane protease YdiL (CAAX protease family)
MNVFSANWLLFSTLLSLVLALLLGMLIVWVWALARIWQGQPLLAEVHKQPPGMVLWGATTVFWVIVLYLFVNFAVGRAYSAATGRQFPKAMNHAEQSLRKDPGVLIAENAKDSKDALDARVVPETTDDVAGLRKAKSSTGEPGELTQTDMLIMLAMINGLLIVLVPALVLASTGGSLADFGLSLNNWRRQMAIGSVAALLMTPAVYAIQSLAIRVWRSQKHPVEQMVLDRFSIGIAMLAIVSTMILAPMIEELLFRGIMQRWLTRLLRERERTPSAGGAQLNSVAIEYDGESDLALTDRSMAELCDSGTVGDGWQGTGSPIITVLPVLITSLFFATMHLAQWPAPIAIFLLSMALGTLYEKTGSLLAVVTMHGTFNGFSTLLLLLEALSRQLHNNPQVHACIGLHLHSQIALVIEFFAF